MIAFSSMSMAETGCNALCSGPGCEDFYPSASLSLLPGADPERNLDAWGDAVGRFAGADVEGSDWSVAAVPGGLLVGQPDYVRDGVQVGRVILVAPPVDVQPVIPLAEWSNDDGGASGFGAAVHAQITDAGFDLWVGAPGYDGGRGALYLFRDAHGGGRSTSDRDLVLVSTTPNDGFGSRLFPCTSLTDDDVPDLIVTAPWFVEPGSWSVASSEPIPSLGGAVFLVRSEAVAEARGQLAPWDVSRVWWGNTVGEGAGSGVSCDRDIDGDGDGDVAIGSPWSQEARGHVSLLSGLPQSGPLSLAADRVLLGPENQDWFGVSLATLQGSDDRVMLAVGGAGYAGGGGQVHLYRGGSLLDAEPVRFASFESDPERQLPDHFGRWLVGGDLDGDDLSDLVVGAPDYKGDARNAFDTGRIWVFYGADREGWQGGQSALSAGLAIGGTEPFTRIGRMMLAADADGNGTDELWVPTRTPDAQR